MIGAEAERAPFPLRLLPWLLTLAGGLGLAAAVGLTVERLAMLRDPGHVPSCSINPVLSCGSVMKTWQAELFGFPNPLLGIAGFAVVTTTGLALLAGARFRRWYWLGLQLGATAGVVFVHWLIFQSLWRIGALCPYCLVVWVVTIPIFYYVTAHNLPVRWLRTYHTAVLAGWFSIIGFAVLQAFWFYWTTLL